MWHVLDASAARNPDLAGSAQELLRSTSRTLILTTGIAYLAWHIVATASWPDELGLPVWLVALFIGAGCILALHLLPTRFFLAQLVWQAGLVAAITLAVYIYQRPEIAFFYALLPLAAVTTLGWPAGLAMAGLIGLLAGGLLPALLRPPPPALYSLTVMTASAFTGLLGWATTRTLLTVTHWSFFSFVQAKENMEEARERRGQIVRLAHDLDQACYRLERANAALASAWKAAADAERFKAEFVANVSHELRTPLNLIVGFSEMMMTSPESYGRQPLPGCYRGDLEAVYHSARHLLALVDDVLDLTRIEVGKIALVREEVDLASLVQEATNLVQDYIAAKGLELRVNVAPDLPPLWLDRLRIRQVLLNLLVNAARFTEHGWIGVEVFRQEEEVVAWVTDTGQGIPPQDLPKIFEEFRSVEQPISAWHSGTGLGLPISKKFIELHHGQMGVESVYGQGTRFWFALPCTLALASSQGASQTHRARPVAWLGASERILVLVHDDAQIAPLLQRYLGGYRVIGASTWPQGLALAQEHKALALVIDATADPPPSGAECLVIRCPLPSGRRAVLALGADDLLVKPVSRQQLLAAIGRLRRPVRRVLIADDDPDVVRLFRRMLSTHIPSQDCLAAYNGEEALHLLRTKKPDLVLLDLVMPEVDGRDVLAQMAADPLLAEIPVIIVSARGQDYAHLLLPGPIQFSGPEGFQLGEVVRVLEAALNALGPS